MVKKRRLDIIILIVLIAIAIGSWIAVTVLFDVNGDYVEVIVTITFRRLFPLMMTANIRLMMVNIVILLL